jgi:hypothetical protein
MHKAPIFVIRSASFNDSNVSTAVISVAGLCRITRTLKSYALAKTHEPYPAAGTGSSIHLPAAMCFFTLQVAMSLKLDKYSLIGISSGDVGLNKLQLCITI